MDETEERKNLLCIISLNNKMAYEDEAKKVAFAHVTEILKYYEDLSNPASFQKDYCLQ